MKGRRPGPWAFLLALASLAAAPAAGAAAPDPTLALLDLHARGGDAWTAVNDFHLDWSRVPDGPRTRVDSVSYRVRDASGAVVVPEVRNERTLGWIADLRVPAAPGEYTAEVWLEGEGRSGPPARVVLRFDDASPARPRLQAPAGWLAAGATAQVGLGPGGAAPLSGLRGYAIALEGRAEEELGAEADSVGLAALPEGVSTLVASAVSGSGMRSASAEAIVRVDGMGPQVELGQLPAEWATGPVAASAAARDQLSGMEAAGNAGPRTTLAVDAGAPVVAAGARVGLVVHGDGVHRLTASARDAVGNWSETGAQAVVRIDETPPRLAFAASQDAAEPERVEAKLTDSVSGPDPERGSIGVRPAGSREAFAALPTLVSRGRLLAHWDSDSYPPGAYEFRASGYDAAGNRTDSVHRSGGSAMVLHNPVKTPSRLIAGFGAIRALVQRCSRDGGHVRCRREAAGPIGRRSPRRTARYGARSLLSGRLATAGGAPLPGRTVTVVEDFDDGAVPAQRQSTVETAADGSFQAALAPGPSRRIEVQFAGTPLLGRSAGRRLRLQVRAPVHLRTSSATAAVGGAPVLFSGSVAPAGAPVPSSGLPVALQYRIGAGTWTQFRSVQTDPRGHFRLPYSFSDDDSRGIRFQFRAQLGRQPAWPYAPSVSFPVLVTGR